MESELNEGARVEEEKDGDNGEATEEEPREVVQSQEPALHF